MSARARSLGLFLLLYIPNFGYLWYTRGWSNGYVPTMAVVTTAIELVVFLLVAWLILIPLYKTIVDVCGAFGELFGAIFRR